MTLSAVFGGGSNRVGGKRPTVDGDYGDPRVKPRALCRGRIFEIDFRRKAGFVREERPESRRVRLPRLVITCRVMPLCTLGKRTDK